MLPQQKRRNRPVMKIDEAELREVYSALDQARAARNRYRKALEQIADDHKTYRGHGDYDEGPLTGEEAQRVARQVLQTDDVPVTYHP